MTVRYANTIPDLLAFNAYTFTHTPVMLGIAGFGIATVTYANFLTFADMGLSWPTAITFLIFEAGVLGFLLAVIALMLALVVIVSHTKVSRAEHIISLADDVFTEKTEYNKTEHQWNAVQKVSRTKKRLFIYVGSTFFAHIVPRRAFADDGEWNAFCEFCAQRVSEAQS